MKSVSATGRIEDKAAEVHMRGRPEYRRMTPYFEGLALVGGNMIVNSYRDLLPRPPRAPFYIFLLREHVRQTDAVRGILICQTRARELNEASWQPEIRSLCAYSGI